ncbi:MAG: hypothetical protein DLM58_19165 [Pseudonocardiales bacterium]|nr:MAG: hypothetical protein DLM58_19165 [Pseudonocardiales bacterium]
MTPTRRAAPSTADDLAALLGSDPGAHDWRVSAVCAQTDPGLFYPDKGESARPGKRVCTGCPVRAQCLQWALEHDERHGIWGGLSDRERRRLKRRPHVEDHPGVADTPAAHDLTAATGQTRAA